MNASRGVLPAPVEALLDVALVAELTVVTETGRAVTYPLIPLYDGENVYMTSAVLFSRKLRHIKANPKVSVALTDPVGVPAEPFARATIQGDATIIEDDMHAGLGDAPAAVAGQGAGHRQLRQEALRHPAVLRALDHRDQAAPGPLLGGRRHRRRSAGLRAGGPLMAKLELADALTRADTYSHAVVSFVDADGYPTSVAAEFTTDAAQATLDIGPLAPEMLPDRRRRGLRHVQPHPPADGRRLRRAPLHQRLGSGGTVGQPAVGHRDPGHRLGRGRHPVLRVRRAQRPDRARVHGRGRRPAPAPLEVVDVLPRDPPAVPHRDDRPDRARWRRRRGERLVRARLVAARARRRVRGAPRPQHGQRHLRRRQWRRRRQRDPDSVQRRVPRHPVRPREPQADGRRVRRLLRRRRRARSVPRGGARAGGSSRSAPSASR